MNHRTVIQLIIAWTLTAVFVFTACATTLSLIGWLRFEHPTQQEKLFYVLIVEVVVVVVGYFKGFLRFWPNAQSSSTNQSIVTTKSKAIQDEEKWGWDKAEEIVHKLHSDLTKDNYRPTLLVGTGRGGAVMGALISGCFGHIPLVVIDRKYDWSKGRRVEGILFNVVLPPGLLDKVLLLDGQAHTGLTMRFYDEYFKRMGAREVRSACFFVDSKSCIEPIHYAGIRSDRMLKLPWMCSPSFKHEAHGRNREDIAERVANIDTERRCIYLVRHGQTTASVADRFTGITQSDLTPTGISQAASVGRALTDKNIGIIFTSPMKRALTTAREMQRILNAQLIIDGRFREIDYGDWEGLCRSEIICDTPDEYKNYTKDPVLYRPPNGESPATVKERMSDFWNEFVASPSYYAEKGIVIVSHNAAIRILLTFLESRDLARYREDTISTGSITVVDIDKDGKVTVREKNRTAHLTIYSS